MLSLFSQKNLLEQEQEEQQSTVSSVRLMSRGARVWALPGAAAHPICRFCTPSLTNKGLKLIFNGGFSKQYVAQVPRGQEAWGIPDML